MFFHITHVANSTYLLYILDIRRGILTTQLAKDLDSKNSCNFLTIDLRASCDVAW